MKRYRFGLILALLLSMTACSNNRGNSTATLEETKKNLFSESSDTLIGTETIQTEIPIWDFVNGHEENNTNYYVYQGDELNFDIGFRQNSDICATEFGIQVFIDGEPQAFRLEGEEDYKYTQILSKEFGTSEIISCSLFPTVGKKGDALELRVYKVPLSGNSPWFELDCISTTGIIKYEEDAVAVATDRWMNVVSNATVRQEMWTTDQLLDYLNATQYYYDPEDKEPTAALYDTLHYLLYLDDEEVGRASSYSIAGKDTVHLRMEVTGFPGLRCSYHIYWNNQLVDCAWDEANQFIIEKGSVIILEADLDVRNLPEDTSMYIMLTPINGREMEYISMGTQAKTSHLKFTYE